MDSCYLSSFGIAWHRSFRRVASTWPAPLTGRLHLSRTTPPRTHWAATTTQQWRRRGTALRLPVASAAGVGRAVGGLFGRQQGETPHWPKPHPASYGARGRSRCQCSHPQRLCGGSRRAGPPGAARPRPCAASTAASVGRARTRPLRRRGPPCDASSDGRWPC